MNLHHSSSGIRRKLLIGGLIALYYLGALLIGWRLWRVIEKPYVSQPDSAETTSFIRARMKYCYEKERNNSCYHQAAVDFLGRFSLGQILSVFGENEHDPEFFSNCHTTAHYLGQEAYRRTKDVRKVFSESSYVCLAGTFHGAVEGYFMGKGLLGLDDAVYAKEIPRVCGERWEYQVPQQFVECNHGMGHALMFLTQDDVLRALKLCDALHTQEEQELCYTGALMANATGTVNTDHPSRYAPKPDDPLYPCPLLEKRYQRQCYTYGVLESVGQDLGRSIKACQLIPADYRPACFQTIGRNTTMTSADPLALKKQCDQISEPDFRNECVKGAAYNLVVRFGAHSSIPGQFCSLADAKVKQDCFSRVESAQRITTQHDVN